MLKDIVVPFNMLFLQVLWVPNFPVEGDDVDSINDVGTNDFLKFLSFDESQYLHIFLLFYCDTSQKLLMDLKNYNFF